MDPIKEAMIAADDAQRANREFELLMAVASAATDVVNECPGNIPPSLGSMAKLADTVHAHWKFQRGDNG